MPLSPNVNVEPAGDIVRLTLNRPDRGNALGPDMVAAIDAGLTAAIDAGARLLVLAGTGRNFCTGFDLSGLEDMTDALLLDRFVRVELLLQRIHAAPLTTLAIATGRTYGAGADLFAACDRRLATPGSRFSFPGAAFGLVLGTSRLCRLVGENTARNLLLDGEEVPAVEAARIGLATAVIEVDALPLAIAAAAKSAARLDPSTIMALHKASATNDDDAALAALVRSAARPGLRDRILAYRARV